MRFLPAGAAPHAGILIAARGFRGFGDGLVSLTLPAYLSVLGFDAFEIGAITTATLLGSACTTLLVGRIAHSFSGRFLLTAASLLMVATGIAFVSVETFWPLLLVAFVGTLNPSSGDVSIFLPLEHAELAHAVPDRQRTGLFARYSLVGGLAGAFGALSAGLPEGLEHLFGMAPRTALQGGFLLYAGLGLVAFGLYRRIPREPAEIATASRQRLGKSRRIVFALAGLFSLDAFAGGLAVQSLIALWLFERYGLSLTAAGTIFFWSGVFAAFSFPVAVWLSRRIGLVNTMVFTHLPANVFLLLVPFMPGLGWAIALLLARSALSHMDIPTRTSYVMAVVSPGERAAAASVTAVPRSLASAVGPLIAGSALAASSFGWPLVACGALKIVYDILLLAMFRKVRPPEEASPHR